MKNMVGLLFGILLLAGLAHGTVFLTGANNGCTLMKPGETRMLILSVKEPTAGSYMITATSDGLYAYPKELRLYLEANKTASRWIKVVAPTNVFDEYYTLDVSVYDANAQIVESKQYCFHVYKGVLESTAPDVVFGYKGVQLKDGKVYVDLYVSNLGRDTVTATLDSDYANVEFKDNPLIVRGYRTVETTAVIPADEHLPDFVRFYATVGGNQKTIVVKMPTDKVIRPDVTIDVPEKIVMTSTMSRDYVRVTNNGSVPISVKIGGKEMPFGVGVTSDVIKVYPKQTVMVPFYIVSDNVLRTGKFLSKICVEDEFGAELDCKYTEIVVPSKKEVEANKVVETNAITVQMSITNGAKKYYGVSVEITAPSGWKYTAEPENFDLDPYETQNVSVSFSPGKNAQDGVAVIKLVAADGTVLAQKVVELKKSALTGYATAGSSSVIGLIVAAIVIALIVAAIVKKGEEVEETDEELKELVKKG